MSPQWSEISVEALSAEVATYTVAALRQAGIPDIWISSGVDHAPDAFVVCVSDPDQGGLLVSVLPLTTDSFIVMRRPTKSEDGRDALVAHVSTSGEIFEDWQSYVAERAVLG